MIKTEESGTLNSKYQVNDSQLFDCEFETDS